MSRYSTTYNDAYSSRGSASAALHHGTAPSATAKYANEVADYALALALDEQLNGLGRHNGKRNIDRVGGNCSAANAGYRAADSTAPSAPLDPEYARQLMNEMDDSVFDDVLAALAGQKTSKLDPRVIDAAALALSEQASCDYVHSASFLLNVSRFWFWAVRAQACRRSEVC